MVPDKTTVEVTHEVWAAMDKRKDEDQSFDDFIRELIDNTAVPMGNLENMDDAPTIEYGEIERVEDPHEQREKGCAYFDPIEGSCGESVVWRQEYTVHGETEPHYFYFCEDHKPDRGDD